MREIIFGVAGGLALFIFGMNLMSDGLKKAAGERLRRILEKVTKNPIISVIIGALVTALIQSSSATTVMAVSFVNARLMTLPQAIGIIFGANVGTTMTAQLIAFNLGEYAYLITAVGFAFYFFPKKQSWKYIGQLFFGFGILFIGMNTMSYMLKPLATSPLFKDLITKLGHNPIMGVLVGTFMTVIIQSSSATIGVLQTIAREPVNVNGVIQPLIPLKAAIPILLGDNIGTTITAILASIGTNKAARRTAAAHSLFNIIGCIIFVIFLPLFIKLVLLISPKVNPEAGITAAHIIKRQIANAHTAFNTLNTLIWLPFTGLLALLVTKLIPGEDKFIDKGVKYLNKRINDNPSLALELSAKELVRMAEFAQEMLEDVKNAFQNNDFSKKENVYLLEDNLDYLQDEIIHYLSTVVSHSSLTEYESVRLADLMHVVGDIERVGDLSTNIFELAEYKRSSNIKFSEEAHQEVAKVFNLTIEMFNQAIEALKNDDYTIAHRVLELEKEVDLLEENLRLSHINRLNQGTCNPNSAVCYVDLMKNLERIADHSNNIAEAVLDNEKLLKY
ncbi:MAG TPA: Na/Pi cotransporter family protein [Bacillota bacterium]|nr:Na/Pi cotransporter family protein [Bacillota bacterium]HOL10010.1 Na/Pi cotransporter family protein [Bacillota bacterium]HPO97759.1 Na/Pi cotransporter family protein [Bacillota bacterium]